MFLNLKETGWNFRAGKKAIYSFSVVDNKVIIQKTFVSGPNGVLLKNFKY